MIIPGNFKVWMGKQMASVSYNFHKGVWVVSVGLGAGYDGGLWGRYESKRKRKCGGLVYNALA